MGGLAVLSFPTEMINTAISAAQEAGKVIMASYARPIKVTYKGSGCGSTAVLTEADLKAEQVITAILKKRFPNHNFYGEEKTREDNHSDYTWYIDPIDGSACFARKIPLFGISIGLVKNHQAVLGVLFFPALDLLLRAEKGKGAWANDKRIKVSQRPLQEALYYSRSIYKWGRPYESSLARKVGIVKILNTSSFELAQIAMGNAELYICKSVPHDVAAGVTIIKEAGGKVTDYDGSDWQTDSAGAVASNGIIHDEVIKTISNSTRQ